MEAISVDVKVGKVLREFINSTAGSTNITTKKDDILWCLIKQNLLTAPSVPYIVKDRTEFINITLPASKAAQTYNCREKRNLQIHTLFRNFLDEQGQLKVRQHFEKEYRRVFIVFMTAQFSVDANMKIIDAINNFCDEYNLEMDTISLQTLKKYWYRYRLRSKISQISPIIF